MDLDFAASAVLLISLVFLRYCFINILVDVYTRITTFYQVVNYERVSVYIAGFYLLFHGIIMWSLIGRSYERYNSGSVLLLDL